MNKVQEVLKSAIETINEARNQIKELCDVHNTPYPITSLVRYNQAIKGCKSALSEIEKCEPVAKLGRWMIDKSTGTDILTLDNCSVIEGKYAHYIMGLLQKEIDKVVSELENTSPQPIENCEPVAWKYKNMDGVWKVTQTNDGFWYGAEIIPLYTSPISRDWVGLTYKNKVDLRENTDWYNFPNDLIEATESKLKQLNDPEKG